MANSFKNSHEEDGNLLSLKLEFKYKSRVKSEEKEEKSLSIETYGNFSIYYKIKLNCRKKRKYKEKKIF